MSDRKVLAIGLDAVTMDLLRPWAQAGLLPNLRRFLDRGAAGELRTTLPVHSAAAWSTFATGLNPGKHGIINFCQYLPDSYMPRFLNASNRRGKLFWEIAGCEGIRGGIINVPVTYPPRPFNGFIVSGRLTPRVSAKMAQPTEVFEGLMAASPNYTIEADYSKSGHEVWEKFLENTLTALLARKQAALGLYCKHRPALFCVVFIAADQASHFYWHHLEAARAGKPLTPAEQRLGQAIQQVYCKLDEAVGELIAEAGEETDVIILSDHGAGPIRKGVNLRKLLAREALLTEGPASVWGQIKNHTVWAFARFAPASLKRTIKDFFPEVSQHAFEFVCLGDVDFSQTKAYPAGNNEGVFVNLRGRQPQGVVAPGVEYEAVRDRIIKILLELTDPDTGEQIVRRAYRREELLSGPCLERLPDVLIERPERSSYSMQTTATGPSEQVIYTLPEPKATRITGWSGDHRRNGVLLAMGPHVKHTEVHNANIADVPATILALLGCPIPEDFDGRVLTEILTDDVALPKKTGKSDSEQVSSESQLSREERAAIEKHLKGLGYL